MDDLAFLQNRIESYADYTNDEARRLTDEQIRAYVGEALSRLLERLHPNGAAGELLERMLLRCQFADQAVIRALDGVDAPADVAHAAIRATDRELVRLADEADTLAGGDAATYIARIERALDERARVITARAAV